MRIQPAAAPQDDIETPPAQSSAQATDPAQRAATQNGLQKILGLLTPAERRRGWLVVAMLSVMALLETVGVASVLPFLAVLGNPAMVQQNELLAWLYAAGGFANTHDFLMFLGFGAFCMVVVSSLFRTLTQYVGLRYTHLRAHSIALRLLQTYLRQPYPFFLHRNSADLSKSILSESDQLISRIFRPAMNIISYGLVVIALLVLLILIDPVIAGTVALGVALTYSLLFLGVRPILTRWGRERLQANAERFVAAGEALGGIKDLKVLGRESVYLRRFKVASERYARRQVAARSLSLLPRNLIEAVGFGGILALALGLMITRDDLGEVLPVLGAYAFAAYRLLPAAQNVYGGFALLRSGLPALDSIHQDLHLPPPPAAATRAPLPAPARAIRFEQVSYAYPQADRPVLHALDLEIPANTTMGFVGSTGAGKTTAIDLILGLLEPTGGRILIDGEPLTPANVRGWQRNIGYVPQSIYLADATVAENIAFGVEPDQIDLAAVERAARIANIDDFVNRELPRAYATRVGERGVRLSGGQRQRLGIARALYHDPALLVFDEATSALDNATEKAVMEAVRRLRGQKTILLVAHRLSTVQMADRIVLLEHGHIRGMGNYTALLAENEAFQTLAAV